MTMIGALIMHTIHFHSNNRHYSFLNQFEFLKQLKDFQHEIVSDFLSNNSWTFERVFVKSMINQCNLVSNRLTLHADFMIIGIHTKHLYDTVEVKFNNFLFRNPEVTVPYFELLFSSLFEGALVTKDKIIDLTSILSLSSNQEWFDVPFFDKQDDTISFLQDKINKHSFEVSYELLETKQNVIYFYSEEDYVDFLQSIAHRRTTHNIQIRPIHNLLLETYELKSRFKQTKNIRMKNFDNLIIKRAD